MSMKPRAVLIAGDHDTTAMVYHALTADVEVVRVIIERPIARGTLFKWRVKRFGVGSAFGQVLFVLLVQPFLMRAAHNRRRAIIAREGLREEPIPEELLLQVASVNDKVTRAELTRVNPTYVIVHGTRIITKKTLQATSAPFINIHAGITPQYRGAHGAYWALVQDDIEHCGVTVHLVDEGVDTGGVLAQGVVVPTARDSFVTYPLLQLALGLQLLHEVLKKRSLAPYATPTDATPAPSQVWAHPTLWGYLWQRFVHQVR